ncbi:MAG: site-2 protease family protein, partial [Gammaproteobacteria bacterium]
DMALVALAGPGANLLMLIFWVLVIFLAAFSANALGAVAAQFMVYMGYAGIFINLVLMLLNMLPIPPLDGSRVMSSVLPNHLAWQYNRIEPYGFIILLVLLFTGVLGQILLPPIDFSMRWLDSLLFR